MAPSKSKSSIKASHDTLLRFQKAMPAISKVAGEQGIFIRSYEAAINFFLDMFEPREYWYEAVKGESFLVQKDENEPFMGDDGHPYEISIQLYEIREDGHIDIGSSIHDLETDEYFPDKSMMDYKAEALRKWGIGFEIVPFGEFRKG
jgi:hypothetical protein